MSTKTSNTTEVVYLHGSYSPRGWRFVLAGAGFGTMGAFLMIGCIKAAVRNPNELRAHWPVAVFVIGLALFFLTATTALLWPMFTARKIIYRIDSSGLTQGQRFVPWKRIRWIAVRRVGLGGGVLLMYGLRPAGVDRGFWTGEPLKPLAAEELLNRLRADLPTVRVD